MKFNIFMPKQLLPSLLRNATQACRPLCLLRRRLPILWGATLKREAMVMYAQTCRDRRPRLYKNNGI